MPFDSHCTGSKEMVEGPLICYAARTNDINRVRELVAAGVPTDTVDAMGYTALQIATERGYQDIIEFLSEK